MTASEFQKEINTSINAQIGSYTVPGSSVLGGFIQRSRSCAAQYNGRQIFEMLQNMDDQTTGDGLSDYDRRSQIMLDKSKGRLLFRNMGVPFSVPGVRSIMYPDVSPKRIGKISTIGNKGLGFRSLLNWSPKEIIIRSNGTELTFSDEVVACYVRKNQALKNALDETTESELPMLAFPEIRSWENNHDGWVTEIELNGILPFVDDIENELRDFKPELMLFLPNLRRMQITIITGTQTLRTVYQASKRTHILDKNLHIQTRTITKQAEGEDAVAHEWLVCWERDVLILGAGREEDRVAYNIEIAVPKDAGQRQALSRTLYNFLPVSGVRINLPCLIHATVNLGDNRNELLVGNSQNEIIFKEKLPVLMKHFATIIRNAFDVGTNLVDDRWLPYRLLAAPTHCDDRNYVGALYNSLRNAADTEPFVPCVDGSFHRPDECCYYVPTASDGCDILKFFNEYPEFVPYYVLVGVPNEPVPFQTRAVSAAKLDASVNRALTCKGSTRVYHDVILVELAYVLWRIAERNSWAESGPYWIFHDCDGKMFGNETDNVYTPMAGDALVFPEYMRADFIDAGLWNALLKRFGSVYTRYAVGGGGNVERAFCNNELHKFLRVEYYDRAAAAKKIISSAAEFLREDFSFQEKRQIVGQLLKALWENFRGDVEPHPREEKIPISVKDNGTVLFAEDILFDDVRPIYDGTLGAEVFWSEEQLQALVPNIDVKRVRAFFRYLGVRADVRIKHVMIGTSEGNSSSYLKFLQQKGSPDTIGGLPQSIANGNALETALELPSLRDVGIVKNLQPDLLFELLVRESIDGLAKLLSDTVSLSWKTVNGRTFHPYTVKWSYVAFQLCDKFKNVIYGENDKTLSDLKWQYEPTRADISVEVIKKLGAKSRFSDLSPEELYGLLARVADENVQPTKDFYKKINAAFVDLENAGRVIRPPHDLRVYASWTEDGVERRAFCPTSEVFYHDNPTHARQLVKERKMFFLGARVGVDSVCRHFGVKKLDERLVTVKTKDMAPGDLQIAFENDFAQKRPTLCVILCRHMPENLESCQGRIAGIQVKLVSSLCYTYDNGPEQNLSVYDYIRDRNEGAFYLCVGPLHDMSQLGTTGLRRLSRSLAGILCDSVRLSNDELQHQFEGCFFDLETAKDDLRDLGYQETLDSATNSTRSYYHKYQSEFKNMADTIWSVFLKPTVWDYMNQVTNRQLQEYFRACELKYLDFITDAMGHDGILGRYCAEHQRDELSDDTLRSVFVEFLKKGRWLPRECEGLMFDWDDIRRNKQPVIVVPSFAENYPDTHDEDLLRGVDGEVSDEYLSLMSFPENQVRLRKLLTLSKEEDDESANEEVSDDATTTPLTIKVGAVNFSSPRIGSMRVTHGGQAMTKKKQKAMKVRGIEAEQRIEAWLREQPGNNHVEGRSGTSRTSGRNDSLHHDISYVNGGKTYYVEVKACDSGEFHISAGELEFARLNPETYRLALVYLESNQFQFVDDVYNKVKDIKVAECWKIAVG